MDRELTIGRGYSNLLRLEGDEISRVHAIVFRQGDGYIVRDLDSKNGVFLNGQRVRVSELAAGDKLQVGKFTLLFEPAPVQGSQDSDRFKRKAAVEPIQREIDEEVYARSQLFSAAGSGSAPVAGNGSDGLRDEVTFVTREEMSKLIRQPGRDIKSRVLDLESEALRRMVSGAVEELDGPGDRQSVTQLALMGLTEAMEASGGVIVLAGESEGVFTPLAIYPRGDDVAVNRVVMREGFSQRRAVLCPVTEDSGIFRDSNTIRRNRIYTLLSVPLEGPAGESGLLYLDRKGDNSESFSMTDLIVAGRIGRLLERQIFDFDSQMTPARGALFG